MGMNEPEARVSLTVRGQARPCQRCTHVPDPNDDIAPRELSAREHAMPKSQLKRQRRTRSWPHNVMDPVTLVITTTATSSHDETEE